MGRLIALLLVSAAVGTLAAPTPTKTHFFDEVGAVKQHSFHTPILEDYLESGFYAWSFGAGTVVTNDGVRLTPAVGDGHGYLWNQYPSELKSFRAHFSFKIAQRPHKANLFGTGDECKTCGVAFWALSEPVRHGDSPFFGVPSKFAGLGVVVHQEGDVHLVSKASSDDGAAQSLDDVSIGKCHLKLAGEQVLFAIDYSHIDDRIVLTYSPPSGGTATPCVTATGARLPERHYFGFTAAAKESSAMGYEVIGIMVMPFEGETEKPLDRDAELKAATFDHDLERKERAFWHETQPDEDPAERRRQPAAEHHTRPDARPKPDHAAAPPKHGGHQPTVPEERPVEDAKQEQQPPQRATNAPDGGEDESRDEMRPTIADPRPYEYRDASASFAGDSASGSMP